MTTFRKKPIVIEARQVGDNVGDMTRIAEWAGGRFATVHVGDVWSDDMTGVVEIPTLEGVMQARPGDWIIQGVTGEFYPIRDDIFRATYDPVAPGPPDPIDRDPHDHEAFVARALFAALWPPMNGGTWEEESPNGQAYVLSLARVAIAAFRVATTPPRSEADALMGREITDAECRAIANAVMRYWYDRTPERWMDIVRAIPPATPCVQKASR